MDGCSGLYGSARYKRTRAHVNRIRVAAVSLLLFAACCACPALAGATIRASITSASSLPVLISDNDSLIDIGPTWHVSLKVCCDAYDIAITPNGQYAYVITATADHGNNGTVTVVGGIDTPDPSVITTLRLPGLTYEIAMSPDGKYAYVVSADSNTLSVLVDVETTHPKVADTIRLSDELAGVAVTPDGKYIYVASWSSLIVLADGDTPSPHVVYSTEEASGPFGVAITPNGKYAYVAGYVPGEVTLLGDVESQHPKIVRSFADAGPVDIAITPDGKNAYVTGVSDVMVIGDAETSPHILKSINVGYPQWGVTASPDGRYAYTVNGDAACSCSSVSVIGMAESSRPAVVDTWQVPASANWAITVPPLVGVYSSFTSKARDNVQKALGEGWPLIANHSAHSGGSATHCPAPFTGKGSDQEVEPGLAQFDDRNSVKVPWWSIWTVAAPGKFSSSPEKVGFAAGTHAARELAEVMKAYPGTPARPAYVVLDPEGATCGNYVPPDLRNDSEKAIAYVWAHLSTTAWNELVQGWNKGIETVAGLTPAVYLSKTEYKILASRAAAPYQHVMVAVGYPATPGEAVGLNIVGYMAFYATCSKGVVPQVARMKTWDGLNDTVQFQDSGADCSPPN